MLRKVFRKQFRFIRWRIQQLLTNEQTRYSRSLLRILLAVCQVSRAQFLGSDGLFYLLVCKFGRFNNTFATFTSLPEVCFRFRGFVLLVQTIKLDLIFMMGDIYRNYNLNPLRKCTSSCRSTEFSDILSWNISQRITKTIPINKKNRHKLCNEMGILF